MAKREDKTEISRNDVVGDNALNRRDLLKAAAVAAPGVAAFFAGAREAHANPAGIRAASLFVSQTPAAANLSTAPFELGTRFTTSSAGQITALRYWRAAGDLGTHTATLWEVKAGVGKNIVSVPMRNETASGWQQQALPVPVPVAPGRTYVVSVNCGTHLSSTTGGLSTPVASGSLTSVGGGVSSSTVGGYPSTVSPTSDNYFRDVVFTPARTLFTTQVPTIPNRADSGNPNYELGMLFRTRRAGKITAIRYWRSPSDTGTHVGHIWSAAGGAPLRIVSFSDETASGWQEQALDQPLDIAADTTYVVSVNSNRFYPHTSSGLGGAGIVNGDLNSVVGNNGVFGAPGTFPTQSFNNGNYFRDVVFVPHNAVFAENQAEGDDGWKILGNASFATGEIAGFASAVSVNRGSSIELKVHVAVPGTEYRIDIYRLGWYGGKGARRMDTLGPKMGISQALPTEPDSSARLVECGWSTTDTLSIPATWTTGLYHAKLTELTTNKQAAIWFVVRDDSSRADILFQTNFTTMLAYNSYGGSSLYPHLTKREAGRPTRAFKVSFERPLSQSMLDQHGAGGSAVVNSQEHSMLHYQYNMARWLESQGYDVTYVTNLEVHANAALLPRHKVFLSVGHDEYWSQEMRTNVENARDQGVHLAFFSANTAYWRVRFETSPTTSVPNRVMVCYKQDWPQDGVAPTNRFRSATNNRPENALLGVMYIGQRWNGNRGFPFVVAPGASGDPYYAYTGLQDGDALPGLVGFEWDADINNGARPSGLVILGRSCVTTDAIEHPTIPDAYSNITVDQIAHAARYTAPSGAKVFATGSIQWVYGLDADYVAGTPGLASPCTTASGSGGKFEDWRAKQIAGNVFADMNSRPLTPAPQLTVYGAP